MNESIEVTVRCEYRADSSDPAASRTNRKPSR